MWQNLFPRSYWLRNSPPFKETEGFFITCRRNCYWSLYWARWIQLTSSYPLYVVLNSHLCLNVWSSWFQSDFPYKIPCICVLPCILMLPSYLIHLDFILINNTVYGEENKVCGYSLLLQTPVTSFLLGSKYSPPAPCFKTPSVFSLLLVWET
jgi:hypothetical protein